MNIKGIEGLSPEDLRRELDGGGRFIIFQYAVSVLVMTFRRSSDIHFVRAGQNPVMVGLPYTLLSLFLGWWEFPWGLIYTPMTLATNLSGGKDVTLEVRQSILRA